MEKEINIVEILKDCPSGMELNCTMFENVTFEGIKQDEYPIIVKIKEPSMYLSLTKTGCWNTYNSAKCVIFPKGKTTWEGFTPPCKFKDGDIIFTQTRVNWISIYKEFNNNYLDYCTDSDTLYTIPNSLCRKNAIKTQRLATEEEKQKLFDAIKKRGYKWNEETKTLEKLPKFKVGDRIKNKNDKWLATRTIQSYVVGIGYFTTINDWVRIEDQNDWELVSDKVEPLFKVGDEIVKKNGITNSFIVQSVSDEYYGLQLPDKSGVGVLPTKDQDDWMVISSKPKFKVGDKIRHKETVLSIVNVGENKYVVEDTPKNYGLLTFSTHHII